MNLTKSQIKKTITIVVFSFFSLSMNSQDLTNNLKLWSGVNVSYGINDNLTGKLSQLFAFNASPTTYSFSQTKLSLSYKIKRRIYVEGGYVRGLFNDSNSLRNQGATSGWFNTLAVDRISGSFSFKHDLVKRLSLSHEIEFQYFFPDLDKYKTRTTYSTRLGYNVKRSSLSPYIESMFYYYQGGIISNGIKRFRLKPGISFKPIKNSSMGISIYYIYQNEFKTDQLPDNDYSVIGTNLSFKIK
ncbi:DUF2490 domain-containing protein [Gaetbulibacter sp. M235]|uniref:DUF2490 domain-containing protein n=1 Tax=Gaetbulibacter sp. M235 TaxID=3126510 RepID=UPI00374EBF69